jgi:hypothetical protein
MATLISITKISRKFPAVQTLRTDFKRWPETYTSQTIPPAYLFDETDMAIISDLQAQGAARAPTTAELASAPRMPA